MAPLMTPGAAAERLIRLRDQAREDPSAPQWNSDREALAMGANAITALDALVDAEEASLVTGVSADVMDRALRDAKQAVGR